MNNPIILLTYKTTSHYTLFELSNKIFQAKFKDESDLIIDDTTVHYIKKNKKLTFKSASVESQS